MTVKESVSISHARYSDKTKYDGFLPLRKLHEWMGAFYIQGMGGFILFYIRYFINRSVLEVAGVHGSAVKPVR